MPPSLCSLSLFLINRGIGLQFGLVPGQQGSLPWLSAAFSSLWKEDKKGKNLSDADSLGGESLQKKKGRGQFATELGIEDGTLKILSFIPPTYSKYIILFVFKRSLDQNTFDISVCYLRNLCCNSMNYCAKQWNYYYLLCIVFLRLILKMSWIIFSYYIKKILLSKYFQLHWANIFILFFFTCA